MKKSCSSCKSYHDLEKGFSKTKKSKDGYKSQCKECERAYRLRSSPYAKARPKKIKFRTDRLALIKKAAEKYKKVKEPIIALDPVEEETLLEEDVIEIYDYEDVCLKRLVQTEH